MKKTLSILFLLFIVFHSTAKDFYFTRLEKLYEKDSKSCLVVAKRHIKFFPSQPASYFFCAKIYKDKFKKAKNLRAQYTHINRAVTFALQFEKLSDDRLKKRADWTNEKIDILNETQEFVDLLDLRNQFAYKELLDDKMCKLNDSYVKIEVKEDENEVKAVFNRRNSPTLFYGLATGDEFVESASLSEEQKLLKLINEERIRLGLNPLIWEEDLAKASRYHSYDLATQNYFNHSSYDRVDNKLVKVAGTFDRITQFYSKSFVNGENIAAGYQSAEKTYQQWYHSKGHYEIMFDPSTRRIGIGVFYLENSPFGYYWTMTTAM